MNDFVWLARDLLSLLLYPKPYSDFFKSLYPCGSPSILTQPLEAQSQTLGAIVTSHQPVQGCMFRIQGWAQGLKSHQDHAKPCPTPMPNQAENQATTCQANITPIKAMPTSCQHHANIMPSPTQATPTSRQAQPKPCQHHAKNIMPRTSCQAQPKPRQHHAKNIMPRTSCQAQPKPCQHHAKPNPSHANMTPIQVNPLHARPRQQVWSTHAQPCHKVKSTHAKPRHNMPSQVKSCHAK